ncbi:MAG: hypothetical protein WKF75_05850 [Singulisphaera sp.]
MRSIFAKILLWSLGTFALSLVAFWAISRTLEGRMPGPDDFFSARSRCKRARRLAFEEGAPSGSRPSSAGSMPTSPPSTTSPTPAAGTSSAARIGPPS